MTYNIIISSDRIEAIIESIEDWSHWKACQAASRLRDLLAAPEINLEDPVAEIIGTDDCPVLDWVGADIPPWGTKLYALPWTILSKDNLDERSKFERWHMVESNICAREGRLIRETFFGVLSERYGNPEDQAMWEAWQSRGRKP